MKPNNKQGVLYAVILVNQTTREREAYKIGITEYKDWKSVTRRAKTFNGYDILVLRTWRGTYDECLEHEQRLLKDYAQDKKEMPKFQGHTECFHLTSALLNDFPKK